MRHAAALAGLLLAVQATSLSARSPYVLKESHSVPQAWSRVGPAPADHIINLHIGLKQSRFDELEKQLWDISDPDHPTYGQHLSIDQVHDLVKPTDEGLNFVLEWLAESAGTSGETLRFSPAKDFIQVSLPVETVERLLDTEYSVYHHEREGHYIIRTPSWALPRHLHEHIDTIQPTNNFMRPAAQARSLKPVNMNGKWKAPPFKPHFGSSGYPNVSQVCDAFNITPTCLRTLYGTIDYVPQAAGQNKVAVTNYLGEVQARSDVRNFLEQYRPDAVDAADTFTNIIIDDGPPDLEFLNQTQVQDQTGLEGSLDAETIIGITYPTPLITYSTGGSPPFIPDAFTETDTNEPYLEWIQYVLGLPDSELPYTVSNSYGDDEQTVPYSYAKKVCSLFAQLGARGVSSLHSSGDVGVGPNGDCRLNDGTDRIRFLPEFPASCPYITTVGGTMDFAPEVVAFDPRNGYSSGGGFSNYFPAPQYQRSIVQKYINSLDGEFDGLYNSSGRGYPDIAAQSVSYAVIWDDRLVHLDGTSAACPTAASVISLLNDVRLAAGQRPLGFLNPALYKQWNNGFHDITSGSALGCNETSTGLGFPAKVGWDAVTGWGTPDFSILKDLVTNAGGYGGYGGWSRVIRP